jgi:hypothetical protein
VNHARVCVLGADHRFRLTCQGLCGPCVLMVHVLGPPMVESEVSIAQAPRRVTVALARRSRSRRAAGAMEVASICVRSGWLLFADSRGGPTPGWGVKMACSRIVAGRALAMCDKFSELHCYSGTLCDASSARLASPCEPRPLVSIAHRCHKPTLRSFAVSRNGDAAGYERCHPSWSRKLAWAWFHAAADKPRASVAGGVKIQRPLGMRVAARIVVVCCTAPRHCPLA